MGKASSSKKVARAAGIGGSRTHRRHTPWGYYGIIILIIILGLVGITNSRERRLSQIKAAGQSTPPTVGTTWFMGYAVYECGTFQPAIKHAKNPEGITTGDGDGVIHIAPTTPSAAGKNATLGKFADAAGMKLNAAELQLPGGKLWLDGDTCEGQPGHVYVMHFAYIGAPGQLYNGEKGQLPKLDPRDVPLGDQELVTIAFVPANKASQIPAPQAYVNQNLTKLAPTSSTTTTVPTATTPTTAKSSTTPTTAKSTTATTGHSSSPTTKATG
jgi:hypothetical protein